MAVLYQVEQQGRQTAFVFTADLPPKRLSIPLAILAVV